MQRPFALYSSMTGCSLSAPICRVSHIMLCDARMFAQEENKLAYTEVHEKFIELVEELLEQHLSEVGLSAQDFVEICEAAGVGRKGRHTRDINKIVFQQLIAVEDFLSELYSIPCVPDSRFTLPVLRVTTQPSRR